MKKRLIKAAIMHDAARMKWILDDHNKRKAAYDALWDKMFADVFG
jgi:hypothetical protein